MTAVGHTIETSTATLVLVAPGFIEQRYNPTTRFSPNNLAESRKARAKLCAGRPCALMIVVPAEVPIEPPLSNVDHFRTESTERSIIALALVTESAMMSSVSKFYFMYFPQAFETRVFSTEEEARTWLLGKLADLT